MTARVASLHEPLRTADAIRQAVAGLGAIGRHVFDRLWIWQGRVEQRHRLAALDARMLADVGITRADALEEAGKPFWRP